MEKYVLRHKILELIDLDNKDGYNLDQVGGFNRAILQVIQIIDKQDEVKNAAL